MISFTSLVDINSEHARIILCTRFLFSLSCVFVGLHCLLREEIYYVEIEFKRVSSHSKYKLALNV